MRAIITSSDIEFSVREVDLGYCTTVESVRQTITMTNTSILAQLYGFCGVPEVSICLVLYVVLIMTKMPIFSDDLGLCSTAKFLLFSVLRCNLMTDLGRYYLWKAWILI